MRRLQSGRIAVILILLGTCTAKIYDLILVEKTFVFSTNIKSYILALEKKQSFFCTARENFRSPLTPHDRGHAPGAPAVAALGQKC
jgi:hypothetical protein